MIQICTYLKEHADIAKVLFQCETDGDLADALFEINQYIWETDLSLIQHTQFDKDSIRLLSSFFISGIYQLIRLWLQEDIQKTPEEIAKLISGVIKFDIFNVCIKSSPLTIILYFFIFCIKSRKTIIIRMNIRSIHNRTLFKRVRFLL